MSKDQTTFVSVVDEETIKRVEQHGAIHQSGLCICPCFDALLTLSKSLPERDRLMKLEGVLSVLTAPESES